MKEKSGKKLIGIYIFGSGYNDVYKGKNNKDKPRVLCTLYAMCHQL